MIYNQVVAGRGNGLTYDHEHETRSLYIFSRCYLEASHVLTSSDTPMPLLCVCRYKHATEAGKRIYAVEPLIVQHPAGFSNTWGRNRDAITSRRVGPKANVLIGVTTSLKSFENRVDAIIKTWASRDQLAKYLDVDIRFFVGEDVLDAVRWKSKRTSAIS